MFFVKLVARPDARLVEVPLELEAELPRGFEGAALLAATGLPRKVKLKAPKDALKLSTAYRTDQLLADLVRSAARASPEDAARVQEATLSFVRGVRERRVDGATLLVRSGEGGRLDISEPAPANAGGPARETGPQAGRAPAAKPGTGGTAKPAAGGAPGPAMRGDSAGSLDPGSQATVADRGGTSADRAGAVADRTGTVADRVAALERRVAQLESALSRRPAEEGSPPAAAPGAGGGSSQRGGGLRRGTAVDAFSEGLRKELAGRATQLLGAADRAAAACDQATRLAAEAVRDLGAPPLGSEGDALHRLAAEAAARQRALQRFLDEVDLTSPAELLMAERLLARLAPGGPEGASVPDPAAPLSALGEQLLRDGRGSELLAVWVARAAPLCRWTLIEPRAGEPLQPALHDAPAGAPEGARIFRALVPGVLRADGSLLARARVSLEQDGPEAADLAASLRPSAASAAVAAPVSAPAAVAATAAVAAPVPGSSSDDDVEVLEDLGSVEGAAPDSGSGPGSAAGLGSAAGPSPSSPFPIRPSPGKPWDD